MSPNMTVTNEDGLEIEKMQHTQTHMRVFVKTHFVQLCLHQQFELESYIKWTPYFLAKSLVVGIGYFKA